MEPIRKNTRPRNVYPDDQGRIGPFLGPPPLPGSAPSPAADAALEEEPTEVDDKGPESATHMTTSDMEGEVRGDGERAP